MQRYGNVDGDSGVQAYEAGDDFIRVQFKDGSIYRYTNSSAGSNHISEMKRLAANGNGLNSYIMKNVKKAYESKEA